MLKEWIVPIGNTFILSCLESNIFIKAVSGHWPMRIKTMTAEDVYMYFEIMKKSMLQYIDGYII